MRRVVDGRGRAVGFFFFPVLLLELLCVQYREPAMWTPLCLPPPGAGSAGGPSSQVPSGSVISGGRHAPGGEEESVWANLIIAGLMVMGMVLWSATPLWEKMLRRFRSWWNS
jgi:hypothetical protein